MPPEVDVGHEAGVVLRVLRGLAAAGKKATLLQLLDGWRKEDKASAKAWSKEQQEQVGGGGATTVRVMLQPVRTVAGLHAELHCTECQNVGQM
jgi:hypothetical protein